MDNSTPKVPGPKRLTFGVELEFMVPWLYPEAEDPLADIEGLPPVLRVVNTPVTRSYEAENEVRDIIKKLLEKHGLKRDVRALRYSSAAEEAALARYANWEVTGDATVNEPLYDNKHEWVTKYGWVDVEIQSPVEPDIPVAFRIIQWVCGLLTSTYRMRVNPSCGLHVHVGRGAERFSLTEMRRISSLVWAAEPLLATLNDPARQGNRHTLALRDRSAMATGEPLALEHDAPPGPGDGQERASLCARYLAQDVRHGEQPVSWRYENRDEDQVLAFERTRRAGCWGPFYYDPDRENDDGEGREPVLPDDPDVDEPRKGESVLDAAIEARVAKAAEASGASWVVPGAFPPWEQVRERTIPRIRLPRRTAAQRQALAAQLAPYGCADPGPEVARRGADPGVWAGVALLQSCASSCEVAARMRTAGSRGTVDFGAYACDAVRAGRRPTIEFRGAEGVLGPWAATWAAICVGLVRFAVGAPPDEFLAVVDRCARAAPPDLLAYDAVDLLDDLALFAEAELAERRVRANRRRWGLEWVKREEGGGK
ncbi:hypothetical protein GGS23DRAFT_611802 [Durotheca rogersii]|uniref:uncharacterized protein n=1 Tax=Durotheca rogersii TaxID=419775 RepID=UPI00221FBFC6|nr:uncharacterized protein GGS23DRAFT_611802 [Durotheca rogersii]KAI5861668.1 hypothetical protein GGS23DRAFT_611802 [Durotheca rogersii]